MAAIETAGLSPADFRFRKKSGRVFVHYRDSVNVFSFFRRKENYLDEEQRFRDRISYELSELPTDASIDSLDELVRIFSRWLETHSSDP